MTLEYTTDQHGLICNLLHQAICEQRPEPDFDPEELGFTGPAERAFALAILEDVLGHEVGTEMSGLPRVRP